ncbi:isochorismatase [Alsobacter metallidurans]|uniref:Isochorismatase n=2 Tax=Alsobacter metallidurans TaxID=340221 RepID=A0A917I7B9_9HYPH|nr:isochorismatase [Alsobacter metallidurans]
MAAARSVLLVIDFQGRLMPSIHDGAPAMANARRLIDAAGILGVPVVYTEQNPEGLGGTAPELLTDGAAVFRKMTFDAMREPGFLNLLPAEREVVVVGCEAHVCVMQTALGLIEAGRRVWLVRDAIGSRRAESKDVAVARLRAAGATVVTAEMVAFEWLGDARHPGFRDVLRLVK